jgi:hypothetical protein
MGGGTSTQPFHTGGNAPPSTPLLAPRPSPCLARNLTPKGKGKHNMANRTTKTNNTTSHSTTSSTDYNHGTPWDVA